MSKQELANVKLTKRERGFTALPKTFSDINEFFDVIKSHATAKFDESIDIAIKLNINAKKSDENMRGNLELSYGIPKKMRIAVIAPQILHDDLKKCGVTDVGAENLITAIKDSGQANYDMILCASSMLKSVLPIAKILGKSGLMPNNKDGTVGEDGNLVELLKKILSGTKLIFRNDASGYIQCRIGKVSFENQQLFQNVKGLVDYLNQNKPPKVKILIKSIYVSSTMGIGLLLPLKLL